MKTWYRSVCDNHGEAIDFFVSNPSCTAHYLGDKDAAIQQWLELHYACSLRMIHHDMDLEKLFDEGYRDVGDSPIGLMRRG